MLRAPFDNLLVRVNFTGAVDIAGSLVRSSSCCADVNSLNRQPCFISLSAISEGIFLLTRDRALEASAFLMGSETSRYSLSLAMAHNGRPRVNC